MRLFWCVVVAGLLVVTAEAKVLSRVKRVIGGEVFDEGKWPWLVSFQGKVPDRFIFGIPISWRTFYCGASLINERWIMTAAHCFQEDNLGPHAILPKYWHARLGDIELDPDIVKRFLGWVAGMFELDEHRTWFLHADLIIKHPQYDRDDLWHNDIALVRLEEPVPTSALDIPEIQAVKLPQQGDHTFPMDGQTCIMKGWGCTENGGYVSDTAMEVDLPKVSDAECVQYWSIRAQDRLCAGHNLAAMGICSGDSGGPLVCQNSNLDWIQVGIASFTSANQPGNVPGVFTRVSSYVTWIEETIRDNTDCVNCDVP